MNYWIFQAKPDRYDLRKSGNLRPGERDSWIATRYRTEMNPGDIVYFWMSGSPDIRGIYGWGRLASSPYPRGDKFEVDVIYEKKLSDYVSLDSIRSKEELKNLLILRVAIGTNFLIDRTEAEAIADLINRGERPEVFEGA